jgi:hypothetical protein
MQLRKSAFTEYRGAVLVLSIVRLGVFTRSYSLAHC